MYHCTSSQAFELALRKWRLSALPLLVRHAISTSQVATAPNLSLISSMTRLARSNLFTSIPLGGRSHAVASVSKRPMFMAEGCAIAKLAAVLLTVREERVPQPPV